MRKQLLSTILTLSLLLAATVTRAMDTPSLEDAAAAAQASVATVRILDHLVETTTDTAEKDKEKDKDKTTRQRVTVCTGVCVEKNWIVAPAFAGSDSQIRMTLPGGQQSQGQLRVIDEYTGLALIEADTYTLKAMKFAKEQPKVGSWVLSAAAWGSEQAVISLGIVGGRDRTVGMQYPPLLQADLRTTETSSGAAMVNREGELLGVVVLVDEGKDRRGWTYAVPVSHVQRLLRARSEAKTEEKPAVKEPPSAQKLEAANKPQIDTLRSSVLVIKRRRPVVGMVMNMDRRGENVIIEHVEKESPASRAGLKVGDLVQSVDGVKIRSTNEATRNILFKQPGDLVTYGVLRDGELRNVEVTLGGGVVLSSAPLEVVKEFVRPKLDIEESGTGRYYAKNGRSEVREVFAPAEAEDTRTPTERLKSPVEQVKLLEEALSRYQATIALQQSQIQRMEKELAELKSKMPVK